MKRLLYLFAAISIILTVVACGSKKVLVEKETVTVTETVHDTVFTTEPDSSYYKAFINCKNGVPVISSPVVASGYYLQAPNVQVIDNTLQVDCYAKAQELFAQWKSKQTTITKEIPVLVPRELTWLQRQLIRLGWFSIVLIIAILVWLYFKFKTIIISWVKRIVKRN